LLKQHCFGAQQLVVGQQVGAGGHGGGHGAAHGDGAQQVCLWQNVGQWNVGQQSFGQWISGRQIFGQQKLGQHAGASGAPAIATTITTLYMTNPPQPDAGRSAPDAALIEGRFPTSGGCDVAPEADSTDGC
jgi:hypothetical protein